MNFYMIVLIKNEYGTPSHVVRDNISYAQACTLVEKWTRSNHGLREYKVQAMPIPVYTVAN